MAVTLISQAIVSLESALDYLKEDGVLDDDNELVKRLINGVSGFMLAYTGRTRLKFQAADLIEYHDGDGTIELWLRECPVRSITQVVLWPHEPNSSVTMAGPTSPAIQNDDMYFDARRGLLVSKTWAMPEGRQTVRVDYRPGYYDFDQPSANDPQDAELGELQLIGLEAIRRRWLRWKDDREGLSSVSSDQGNVTYSPDDFKRSALDELKKYRANSLA